MKKKAVFEKGRGTQRILANAAVITYCDFGTPGRKTEIGRHLTLASAMRQYARIWNIYPYTSYRTANRMG